MDLSDKYKKQDGSIDYAGMSFFLKTDTNARSSIQAIQKARKEYLIAKIEQEKREYMDRQVKCQKNAMETVARDNSVLGRHRGRIDGRTYFRWLKEDPYFWMDRKNVDKFLRQNKELDRSNYEVRQKKYI